MLIYWIAYAFAFTFFGVLRLFYYPLTVTGRANIPAGRSFIVACNHLSYLDPPLLGYIFHRPMAYMAKDSLFRNKLLGLTIHLMGAFPVNRDANDTKSIRQAIRRIKDGWPLVIFPGGTRAGTERAGQSNHKPQAGVGFLAAKAGVSVVPVFVSGTDKVLPPAEKRLHRHPVSFIIGEPITPQAGESYVDFTARTVAAIEALREGKGKREKRKEADHKAG